MDTQTESPRIETLNLLLNRAVVKDIPHGRTNAELAALSDADLTTAYIRLMRAETVPVQYRAKPTAQSRQMHLIRVSELSRIRVIAAERKIGIDAAWRADCEPERKAA